MVYQGIPEDVLLSVVDKKTAKETWESEFEALNMKDIDRLDDFCMKLNGIISNIRILGEEMGVSCVVKRLLRAVPDRSL